MHNVFVRGGLLGRARLVGDTPVALVQVDELQVEIGLLMCATSVSLAFRLDHVLSGGVRGEDTKILDALPVGDFTQGVILSAQSASNGLMLARGDSLWVEASEPCTVSAYGILAAIPTIPHE